MSGFNDFAIARALHVLAVLIWIGGVAFVTLVLIPACRGMAEAQAQRMLAREQGEVIKQAQASDTANAMGNAQQARLEKQEAAKQGFVSLGAAFENRAVGRKRLARQDPDHVTGQDSAHRDPLEVAIGQPSLHAVG